MFYNNLGATAGNSILTGSNTANLALFTNIQPDGYWSGTEYTPGPNGAWYFPASNGTHLNDFKDGEATRGPCAPVMSSPPCPSRPVWRWSG